MRMKMMAGLTSAAILCGCLAGGPVNESENVDETQEALSSASMSAGKEHLPQWKVFLIGESYDGESRDWRWRYPPSVDRAGQVVAVLAGDEELPEKWIALELEQHWMHGDVYFDALMAEHGLTLLDLLMIHQAMVAAGDTPPPPPRKLGTMDCYECVPAGPIGPFGPLGRDDHLGPAPGAWGGPPKPPPPAPAPPHRHKPTPAGPRPGKPDPKREEKQRAWGNGVRPGDPEPKPAPTDATYGPPAPNEIKETFKCEGSTYYGFKGGCVDFKAMSTTVKWGLKIGLFLESAGEQLRREVLHQLFHDGKGPGCVADCKDLSYAAAGVGTYTVMALCVAATRGAAISPCINQGSQLVAWAATTVLATKASAGVEAWCSTNICEK